MTIYLAVDSSMSMRAQPEKGFDKTCWQVACEVATKVVERITASGITQTIKLVDFSHNSSILLHKTQSPKEVEKALSGVNVSASADLLSLFSLMKMEKVDEQSSLVVITDIRAFTPEEVKYSHIPGCGLRFVSVLDEKLVDEDQLMRFIIISAMSAGVNVDNLTDSCASYMPLFVSEFATTETFSIAVAAQICPPPDHTLHCGMLSAPINTMPMKYDREWESAIEIIGFLKSVHLANAPLEQHHYVCERFDADSNESDKEASNGLLTTLSDALSTEDMCAICCLNEHSYGVLRYVKCRSSDERLLSICAFPQGADSILWLPHLETLIPQAVTDSNPEGVPLCSLNDVFSKPSYARSPLTCWLDTQGIQTDFQKVIRLLRKIPDRTAAFYTEINRMHKHACSIGAADVIEKLAILIETEAPLHAPVIKKHGAYVSDLLRKSGVKDATEIREPR